jgi:hypothetical protein
MSTQRQYDWPMTRAFLFDFKRDKDIRPVRLDRQFQVWAGARIEIRDELDMEIDVDIVCSYSSTLRRIAANSVTAIKRNNGPEVTSALLRTIRVQEYMRRQDWPVSFSLDGNLPDRAGYLDDMKLADFDELLRTAMTDRERWAKERLLWHARTYRYAEVIGLDPAQELARRIGLSSRTATRRVAEIRAEGLLGDG